MLRRGHNIAPDTVGNTVRVIAICLATAGLLSTDIVAASATPTTVVATRDTWVGRDTPTAVRSADPTLGLRGTITAFDAKEAFLEFDLSAVGAIDSLELLLEAHNFNVPNSIEVSLTPSFVDLDTLTWNGRPPYGTILATAPITNGSIVFTLPTSLSQETQPVILRLRLTGSGWGNLRSLESAYPVPRMNVYSSLPDLRKGLSFVLDPAAAAFAGSTTLAKLDVMNSGASAAGPCTVAFYYSDTTSISTLVPLGSIPLPQLAAGTSVMAPDLLTLPAETLQGQRYIHYYIDSTQVVGESDESNNRGFAPIWISGAPDLEMAALSVSPAILYPGQTATLHYTVTNRRTRTAQNCTLRFFESPDSVITTGDTDLLADVTVGVLLAGASLSDSVTITIPSATPTGTRHLGAYLDVEDSIPEFDETNNTAYTTYESSTSAGTVVVEPDSLHILESAGTVTVHVRRAQGGFGAVGVSVGTQDDTALAGVDYVSSSAVLQWADGDVSERAFLVPILDDTHQDPLESFRVQLLRPTGGVSIGSPSQSVVTIDDDDHPGRIQLATSQISVSENTGLVTLLVQRVNGFRQSISVSYSTYPLEAISPSDFAYTSGTLIWPDGDTADKAISIPLVNDSVVEYDERFGFSIANPTGGAILGSPTTVTVTIVDDEPRADLYSTTGLSVSGNAPYVAGSTFVLGLTVRNAGTAPASSCRTEFSYADDDTTASQILLGTASVPPLGPGDSAIVATSVTLPPQLLTGPRYFLYRIDDGAVIIESNESNNFGLRSFLVSSRPDLTIPDISIDPNEVSPGGSATIRYTLSNTYTRTTSPVTLRFYESPDSTITAGDTDLSSDVVVGPLLAGDAVVDSVSVTLPIGTPDGSRFLGVVADATNAVAEQVEANNWNSRSYQSGTAVGLPTVWRFDLFAPSPNPSQGRSVIGFTLDKAGITTLRVYDARGRFVRDLLKSDVGPGEHIVVWDGRDRRQRSVGAGVYFVQLESSGQFRTRRLLLVR